MRFQGDIGDWKQTEFSESFNYLQNNSLSRANLNYDRGLVKNVHYGDVLIKFGEVLDVSNAEIPYISDPDFYFSNASLLQDGDVVIADAAEDETVGKCSEITSTNGTLLVSGLHTIPCRPINSFAKGYLGYYLNSSAYHDQLLPLIQGTKISSISKSALRKTNIAYPMSQKEQREIGAYFQELDNLITRQQDKLTKLMQFKQAMLQKMFPKKDEKEPGIRFDGFDGEWEEYQVKEIYTITRGEVLAAPKVKQAPDKEYRYPVFSSQTKNNGFLGYYKNYLFENAITWTTDGANAGTVSYREGKFYSTNVNGVLLNENGYANKAMAENINNVAWKYVTRAGNPKLMNNVMGDIKILVPSLEEQIAISNYFVTLDKNIQFKQAELTKLKQFKQAMLDKMFV